MNSINTAHINTAQKQIDPDLKISFEEQLNLRQPHAPASSAPTSGFLEALEKSMAEVNVDQLQADQAIKDIVAGKSKNIHETMLAIQKADLSLKTMMQVRNKVLEAYKEIMRMQV